MLFPHGGSTREIGRKGITGVSSAVLRIGCLVSRKSETIAVRVFRQFVRLIAETGGKRMVPDNLAEVAPPFVNVRQGSEARAFSPRSELVYARTRNEADATAESADKVWRETAVRQSLCSVAVKGRRGPVRKLHMSKLEVKKGSGAEGMVVTGDILLGRTVRDVVEVTVASRTHLRLVSAGVAEE